jgi:hypothetical protein
MPKRGVLPITLTNMGILLCYLRKKNSMTDDTSVEIARNHLINWPQSVDSQLWNDRMNSLLTALEEFERQVNESKTKQG